jgi:membrane associated rhomboid family serine protease
MIIPYDTDAPIYHWPFATLGTIIANVLIFLGIAAMSEDRQEWVYEHFMLVYGHWNTLQWLTSNYLHADIWHVTGNMIVLWGIGIIVEGKIGWWRFLTLYNLIGVFQCGVEQTLTIASEEGGSLGASAIIYGLIAIAMVWAPRNELNCVVILFMRAITFDLPVATYAGISIGIELVLGILSAVTTTSMGSFVAMTGQVLHLMGAATGFAIGVAMLKWKWVDCENWDLFSVMKDRHLMSREQLAEEALTSYEGQAKLATLHDQMRAKLREYLAAGEAAAALALVRRGRKQFGASWQISPDEQIQLISGLRKAQQWNDAVEVMVDYLKTPLPRAPAVRLALAQILIEQLGRPIQALKVLARVDPSSVSPSQQAALSKLRARAERAAEDDPFEVAAEDW